MRIGFHYFDPVMWHTWVVVKLKKRKLKGILSPETLLKIGHYTLERQAYLLAGVPLFDRIKHSEVRRDIRANLQDVEAKPIYSRRAVMVRGGLTLGLAALGLAYTVNNLYNEFFGINLHRALRNEEIRQAYLDNVVEQSKARGEEPWQSIARAVYDPNFNQLMELEKRLGRTGESADDYYTPLYWESEVITPYFGNDGQKSIVYVSRRLFDMSKCDDEVCSWLDNEAINAMIIEKGRAHLDIPGIDMKNFRLQLNRKVGEVLSFEYQFYNIMKGRRKVSQEYVEHVSGGAKRLYKSIATIVDYPIEKLELGHEKLRIVEALRYLDALLGKRGTLYYFR